MNKSEACETPDDQNKANVQARDAASIKSYTKAQVPNIHTLTHITLIQICHHSLPPPPQEVWWEEGVTPARKSAIKLKAE